MKCSICGKEIKGYGNNSTPLKRGKCCDECNANLIIPLRMFLLGTNKKQLLVIKENGEVSLTNEMEEAPLEMLQELVDGYIEVYPDRKDDFVILMDEEGILKKKEINFLAYEIFGIKVVGTIVLCPTQLFK